MQYTLGQACKELSQYTHAYGVVNVKSAINRAIRALASMSGWECLRKTLRFSSVGPCFTLPQGSAGLVRACVNGSPSTVRGQDFRFIHSGPGDMSRPPHGFCPVPHRNILDLGTSPVMVEPLSPFRLFAYSDGSNQPFLLVRGLDPSGRDATVRLPMKTPPTYDPVTGEKTGGEEAKDIVPDQQVFQTITSVVVDECADSPITLYSADTDTDERVPIALYHPEVKAPEFRRYEISGVHPDQRIEILAEVRIDPLPLIRDTDILPIDTLEPIEWMIMADWKMKASEVDAAQKYQNLAAQWMKAHEVRDNTVQTSIVLNSNFDGSMGEVSMDSYNI